jgi:hypothetical protein
MELPQPKIEPSDDHFYSVIAMYPDTFRFLRKSVEFYLGLLEKDIAELESDADLQVLLGKDDQASLQAYSDRRDAKRVMEWMDKIIEQQGKDEPDYEVASLSHRTVRFLKSVGLLYLQYLLLRRNQLAARPNISRHVLQDVDRQIALFKGKINAGIFGRASPLPLLASEFTGAESQLGQTPSELPKVESPRPVVIDSIQLLDPELRRRCLDLFHLFSTQGEPERLDTVVAEATKILEARLRSKSGAPPKVSGADLASLALAGKPPLLKISDDSADQEAVHLLFRGVLGLLRNPAHHEVGSTAAPERILQVLGTIDYLLSLVEGAESGRRMRPAS